MRAASPLRAWAGQLVTVGDTGLYPGTSANERLWIITRSPDRVVLVD